MTDPNVPSDAAADATPTEALHLADQQPVEPVSAPATPAAAPAKANHTRTILEVVGGVVAAALIVLAGVAGFALGHATGGDDRGEWAAIGRGDGQGYGQDGFGQGNGQQGFGQGRDHHDGDGDGFMRGDGDGFMRGGPEGGQPMPGQQPAPQG